VRTFDDPYLAYRIRAHTWSYTVGVSPAIGRNTALTFQIERAETSNATARYVKQLYQCRAGPSVLNFMKRFDLSPALLLLGARVAVASGTVAGRLRRRKTSAGRGRGGVALPSRRTAGEGEPPAEPVTIEQRGQEFAPYVTPILLGTTIAFPNRDSVQHQVYSLSKPKRFELPLYSGNARETVTFDQPGVVTLGCNIHDWMVAYIVVLATPHFAASARRHRQHRRSGRRPLPARSLASAARRQVQREIVIASGDPAPQIILLTLKPDRRIRRAPDASGGGTANGDDAVRTSLCSHGKGAGRWSALSPTRFRVFVRQRRGAARLRPLVVPGAAGAHQVRPYAIR